MIRGFLQRFMYGRYGWDQLGLFLMVLCWIFYLVFFFTGWLVLDLLFVALWVVVLYRMFSRQIAKRQAENRRFLQLVHPITQKVRMMRTIYRDKEHRYFRCPNCGQQLRVPRGKGRITVTCRSCGVSFEQKS